jgi:hypothetical protein
MALVLIAGTLVQERVRFEAGYCYQNINKKIKKKKDKIKIDIRLRCQGL